MIRQTAVCAAVSLVFAALGCSGTNTSSGDPGGNGGAAGGGTSGGSTASGGAFSPSVSGSAQLGSLSDSDTQQLCDELKQYVSGAPFQAAEAKFSCGVSGLLGSLSATEQTDAAIQMACQTAYDTCVSTLQDMGPTTSSASCDKPDAGCTATVAEYTACLNDAVKVFDTTMIPSCSSLTAGNVETALLAVTGISQSEPASCTAYEMKCPSSTTTPVPGGMPVPGGI